MIVDGACLLGDWLDVARGAGFEACSVEDLSQAVRPKLLKHQQIAERFFNRSRPRRTFYRVMKLLLTRNAIAGLLVPMCTRRRCSRDHNSCPSRHLTGSINVHARQARHN